MQHFELSVASQRGWLEQVPLVALPEPLGPRAVVAAAKGQLPEDLGGPGGVEGGGGRTEVGVVDRGGGEQVAVHGDADGRGRGSAAGWLHLVVGKEGLVSTHAYFMVI